MLGGHMETRGCPWNSEAVPLLVVRLQVQVRHLPTQYGKGKMIRRLYKEDIVFCPFQTIPSDENRHISRNDADVVGVRNGCTFTGWTGRYWIKKNVHCFEDMQVGCTKDKVNRCLARYSPRATTTNRPTNRAPNACPGPNWPKMPILGQIWSFLGTKSFFLLEKSKVLLPT